MICDDDGSHTPATVCMYSSTRFILPSEMLSHKGTVLKYEHVDNRETFSTKSFIGTI